MVALMHPEPNESLTDVERIVLDRDGMPVERDDVPSEVAARALIADLVITKAAIESLRAELKPFEAREAALREQVSGMMQTLGIKSLDTPRATVTLVTTSRATITDESVLRTDLFTRGVLERCQKIVTSIDTAKVKELFDAGVPLAGFALVSSTVPRVSIKATPDPMPARDYDEVPF